MNLQHLRYLLAVSRLGSFTAAASAMHVTQPAVSGGIAELESEFGVKLFHRHGRRIELTNEGRSLTHYAVSIQDLVEEAGHRLTRRRAAHGETFQFGSIDAGAIHLLPDILRDYVAENPGVQLSVQVAPSRYLAEDVLMNRSEFAVITLPYEHPRLETLSLCADRLILCTSPSHPFNNRRSVTMKEVIKEPLILFHNDSVSRRLVDEKFAEAGLTPRVVMAMRSPEAMQKLVEAGVGISFLPFISVRNALESKTLKEVRVKGVSFSREIGLAWKRGRYFGPAIQDLLAAIAGKFGKGAALKRLRAAADS
ncbi:MAG TPA: LysR family transcriptional regulator [Terriglobia bacterium]|nr:LysR family transcriptional regulator [Terriglobia bacterium]